VIIVTGRNRPHELLLLVYGAFIAIVSLARAGSGSVAATSPRWLVVSWAIGLLVSAVAGLTGVLWHNRTTGLQLELGAMLVGAGAVLIYAYAVLSNIPGWPGLISSGLLAAWTMANLWRATQIARDLRSLTRVGE